MLLSDATDRTQIAGTPVLELRDVSVGYEDQAAVKGVTLAIEPGDVVALIGPNGSGKSTLVRGILGLAQVLDGQVRMFGDPDPGAAQHRRIGYVPQRHTVGGAIPSTVEEVVSSGRLMHRRWYQPAGAADRTAVAEAIAAVGLGDRAKAMVSTLSGGQQRRVLIARALAGRPDVLIMDEPTAGVDAESQETLVATLHSLVGRGLTLLIVTHEIAPLRPMLTRVLAMSGGRLVRDTPLVPGDPRSALPIRESQPHSGHHDPGLETGLPQSQLGQIGEQFEGVLAAELGPDRRRTARGRRVEES